MKHLKSELAKKITYHAGERLKNFKSLSLAEQSSVFAELSANLQQQILSHLTVLEVVDLVDHLDLQTAQKVALRIKDVTRRNKIIQKLKTDVSEKIEYFLRFHPKASLSLIHFNYILIPVTETVGEAGDIIESHYQESGKFPEILVHDRGVLVGEISLTTLVKERNKSLISRFIKPVKTITYQAEVNEIVNVFADNEHHKVVVLDQDNSVLGIIYSDDALSLFGKLPAESLYNMAGVDESERPFDSVYKKFSNRYLWLIVNLFTAFLAGSVILVFQDTVDRLSILAVYIPVVCGMGGNASSQTFAVVLRGITMGSVSLKNGWPVLVKESLTGLVSGLMIGSIVALISVVFHGSLMLGVVVGLALVIDHIVAGLFGAFIPLFMKSIGKDPAATSMIFVSTATDVFGILSLLGLGTLFLL